MQYLKSRPKDAQIKASLQFLLSAMHALKRKNPLTESFLVQLDVDLEGAGLENTSAMRASMPTQQAKYGSKSAGCPTTGEDSHHIPAYGDNGLGMYTDPSSTIPMTTDAPNPQAAQSHAPTGLNREESPRNSGFIYGRQFDLQNRQQRSPASNQSPGMGTSPQGIINPEMDTSPDGSGGGDRPTPNSSAQSQHNMSSHTSNSAYSPQNMQQSDANSAGQTSLSGMYTQADLDAFTADLDMHNFSIPQQQSMSANTNGNPNSLDNFVWNNDLQSGGTGFTPGPTGLTPGGPTGLTPGGPTGFTPGGPTGFTPGASGPNDFMNNFTEADWNEMMQGMDFQSWDTNVEHGNAQEQDLLHDRMKQAGLIPRDGPWPRVGR